MGRPLKEIITALPVERQERVEARYRKLTAEIEHLHQTALPTREPTQQKESLAPLKQRYVDPHNDAFDAEHLSPRWKLGIVGI